MVEEALRFSIDASEIVGSPGAKIGLDRLLVIEEGSVISLDL